MLVKPLSIYPHVHVSTWSVIGPLTLSDIYITLHNVALFVLISGLHLVTEILQFESYPIYLLWLNKNQQGK